jgi:hypothetical protein
LATFERSLRRKEMRISDHADRRSGGILRIMVCFGYLANSLVAFGVLPFADVISRVVGPLTICELRLFVAFEKDQPRGDPP